MNKYIEPSGFVYKITYQMDTKGGERIRDIVIVACFERKALDIFWAEYEGQEDIILVKKIELVSSGVFVDKALIENDDREFDY